MTRKELKNNLHQVLTGQKPLSDVWHYLVGNYRYKLYYSCIKIYNLRGKYEKIPRVHIFRHPLMRRHIWEQIVYRIKWMDRECYNQGSCKICGCQTTHLQMCDKMCEKPCYPPMMDKDKWDRFKRHRQLTFDNGTHMWLMSDATNEPLLFEFKNNTYVQVDRDRPRDSETKSGNRG